jgi:hypothetical protein
MGDVSEKLEGKLRPPLEQHLEPGEQLVGMCVAVQQSAFRGSQVALGVTDRRVLIQPLDRRFEPKGDLVTISPRELADAAAQGAGGGWVNVGAAIMDRVAITLKLRKVDGTKVKLQLMRGGDSFLGRMGGGEVQEQGIAALAEWLARHPPT